MPEDLVVVLENQNTSTPKQQKQKQKGGSSTKAAAAAAATQVRGASMSNKLTADRMSCAPAHHPYCCLLVCAHAG